MSDIVPPYSKSLALRKAVLGALILQGSMLISTVNAADAEAATTAASGLSLDPFQTLVYDPLFAISKPLGNVDPIGQYIKEPLQNAVPQLAIKGYIESRTQVNLADDGKVGPYGRNKDWTLQKQEWRFNLDTKFHVNDSITIGSVFGFQYDGAYTWQSTDGLTANHIDKDAEYYATFDRVARELWVQYDNGPLSLKVGRQQIVWGKMDGKILDIINPDDSRDGPSYDQSDYEWRRIPLTAVNLTYRISDSTILQGVWVPEFRASRGVLAGSPYSLADSVPGQRESASDAPDQFSIADSAGGGRIDTSIGALTLSGVYYYGYDYSGVGGKRDGGQDFLHYARTNNVGFAADYGTKILGQDLTLRSEALYVNGIQFPSGVDGNGDTIWNEKDQLRAAVAAETAVGPSDSRFNLMFQPIWFHTFEGGGDVLIYLFNISHSIRATGDRLVLDATFYPRTVNSKYDGLGINVGATWRFSQWLTARAYYWNFSGPGESFYGGYDKFDVFGLNVKYEF